MHEPSPIDAGRRVHSFFGSWLVVPKDAGVFHGSRDLDGLRCVHPVQAYLDLQGHPERSEEASESVREALLNWGRKE